MGGSAPPAVTAAALASEVLTLFLPEPAPWLATVRRCVQALRGRGELVHLGSLAPRGIPRWRLSCAVQASAVAGWLHEIGWPGDPGPVGAALFAVEAPFARVGVQLEIGPELGEYLGIECREFDDAEAAEAYAPPLVAAVGALADLGRDPTPALLGWPAAGGSGRRHGYIKLVRAGSAWSAKLYLGLTGSLPPA